MNKCILAILVTMMTASVASANEDLWKRVKKAYDSGLEEDWKAVEVLIKTDKTINKYYAPDGEQAVFHYVVAACQFALAELLVEIDPSVIEAPLTDNAVVLEGWVPTVDLDDDVTIPEDWKFELGLIVGPKEGEEDPSAQSLILEPLLDDEMDQVTRARADNRVVLPRSAAGWYK